MNWKILTLEEFEVEAQKILSLREKGELDYIVFDTETSSLEPWTGELLMYSFCYGDVGYAVPRMVTNTFHFTDPAKLSLFLGKEIPDDISEQGMLEMLARYKIPWEISPIQAKKIDKIMGEVISKVPIVGHNLKFDIKWIVWHQIVKLKDIKIKEDTLNLAFQIYGKRMGKSL